MASSALTRANRIAAWNRVKPHPRPKCVPGVASIGVIKSGSESRFGVTVRDEKIIITLLGTWFTAIYRKLPGPPHLLRTNVIEDMKLATKKANLLARASQIANNKARELGWFV
jgi:hypothetical protein